MKRESALFSRMAKFSFGISIRSSSHLQRQLIQLVSITMAIEFPWLEWCLLRHPVLMSCICVHQWPQRIGRTGNLCCPLVRLEQEWSSLNGSSRLYQWRYRHLRSERWNDPTATCRSFMYSSVRAHWCWPFATYLSALSSSGMVWLSSQLIFSWAFQTPGDGRTTVRNELFIIHVPSGRPMLGVRLSWSLCSSLRKTRAIPIGDQQWRVTGGKSESVSLEVGSLGHK